MLQAEASAPRDGPSTGHIEASSHMLGTLRWNGITSVLDAGGNPVVAYSVLSESGTDWRVAAVPEPSAAVLSLFGLLAIAAAVRFRRSEPLHAVQGRDESPRLAQLVLRVPRCPGGVTAV